jgi:hypothetical protein
VTSLTFPQMAERLGVGYCRGILPTGHYCRAGEHGLNGFTLDGVVHLAEPPRVDRWDAFVFLRLAAQALDPTINADIPWRRVYRLYRGVQAAAGQFHMSYPPRYWRADKAFVLAGVAGLSNDVPLRKQAFNWARRTGR